MDCPVPLWAIGLLIVVSVAGIFSALFLWFALDQIARLEEAVDSVVPGKRKNAP